MYLVLYLPWHHLLYRDSVTKNEMSWKFLSEKVNFTFLYQIMHIIIHFCGINRMGVAIILHRWRSHFQFDKDLLIIKFDSHMPDCPWNLIISKQLSSLCKLIVIWMKHGLSWQDWRWRKISCNGYPSLRIMKFYCRVTRGWKIVDFQNV